MSPSDTQLPLASPCGYALASRAAGVGARYGGVVAHVEVPGASLSGRRGPRPLPKKPHEIRLAVVEQ